MPFSTTYSKLKTFANLGTLLGSDLNSALEDIGNQLAVNNVLEGINEGSNTRRGKFIQATAGTRASNVYGDLSNGPDQVAGIILPVDGLIFVFYQAVWQASVANDGQAAFYINNLPVAGRTPTNVEPTFPAMPSVAGRDIPLVSYPEGFNGILTGATPGNYTGDVTTGQILGFGAGGGPAIIMAQAGTYTVSVRFRALTGSVTVKNRIMRVRTKSFG